MRERPTSPLVFKRQVAPSQQIATETESNAQMSARALARCSQASARELLPYDLALRLSVLPLGVISLRAERVLTCAAPEGHGTELANAIRFAINSPVKLIPVSPTVLSRAIYMAYKASGEALQESAATLTRTEIRPAISEERPKLHPASGDAAKFLGNLIEYAIAKQASDIHLIPGPDGGHVKLRVDGDLLSHDTPLYASLIHQQVIARLRVLAGLPPARRNAPIDGSFEVTIPGGTAHLRLSIMPTVHGDKAVLRIRGAEDDVTLESLGIDSLTFGLLSDFMRQREGLILFAGSTGSGKSTTMYAMVRMLANQGLSVVSIEDPVEQYLHGVSQTSIAEESGLTYASCLRSVVRQDPDVILVGEIRDPESAAVAFQAAMTGHLMLSTVHARDVFEVLLRLATLQVAPLSIAQATSLIVCQRLLPRLCSRCKVIDLAQTNVAGSQVFQPIGCHHCHYTGFDGQVLACESLLVDREISSLIRNGRFNQDELSAALRPANFRSLEESLRDLRVAGVLPGRSERGALQ